MPNPYFKFKQFTVFHDRCAMKVGTDGSLLGAWAEVEHARQVLDIGTGTGLIALMAAQRSRAQVTAVDIDADAAEQARENAARSPWKDRIAVERMDARQLPASWEKRFDAVVSNPPYFVEDVKSPSSARSLARHSGSLEFGTLLREAGRVLAGDGVFSVVLPASAGPDFTALALRERLYLSRQTWVLPKPGASPKRVLLAFTHTQPAATLTDELVIETAPRVYSPEFVRLLSPFYLAL